MAATGTPLLFAQTERSEKGRLLADFDGTDIQRIADPANMSQHELEHLIEIALPAEIRSNEPFKAVFSLPNHPNSTAHHVTWMRIFVDNQLISFLTLAPVWVKPDLTLTLQLPKGSRIEALAECNKHGLWGNAAPVQITYPAPPAGNP